MTSKTFTQLLAEARRRDTYWAERAKLDFVVALNRLMERRGVSRTAFAKRLGSSAAYITKVMKGDVNFTIESMVKLTRALDGSLDLQVRAREDEGRFIRIIDGRDAAAQITDFPETKYREIQKVSTTHRATGITEDEDERCTA